MESLSPDGRSRRKRDRSNAEIELKYKQNKRILNEGLQSLSLSGQYTTITDDIDEDFLQNSAAAAVDTTTAMDDSQPKINSKIRSDSECTSDTDAEQIAPAPEEEHLVSVLKGGQVKYLRKVDFLVDDLIRKTHRTEISRRYCPQEFDSRLPASTGPSPTLDHALSNPLWPVKIYDPAHFRDGAAIDLHPHNITVMRTRGDSNAIYLDADEEEASPRQPSEVEEDRLRGYTVRHPREKEKQPFSHAGDFSHADCIVDVTEEAIHLHNSRGGDAFTHLRRSANGPTVTDDSDDGFKENNIRVYGSSYRYTENDCDSQRCQGDAELLEDEEGGGEEDSEAGGYRDHSCDGSSDSGMSTLSNISAPRVPYYIDADDNVYYVLDRPGASPSDHSHHNGHGRGKVVLPSSNNNSNGHFAAHAFTAPTKGVHSGFVQQLEEASDASSSMFSRGPPRHNSYDAAYGGDRFEELEGGEEPAGIHMMDSDAEPCR